MERNPEPRYSRPIPDAWSELLVVAQHHIDSTDDRGVTYPIAADMFYLLGDLSDEEAEENRYYGLGLGMCTLARELADPIKRASTVEWAARNLVSSYREYAMSDNQGMRPGDLSPFSTHYPFTHLLNEAKGKIPPAELLLADSLIAQSKVRKGLIEMPKLYRDRSPFISLEKIVDQTYLTGELGMNADAAAFTVVQHVLADIYGGMGSYNQDLPFEERTLGPVIELDLLRSLDLKRLAINCAKLRQDEFIGDGILDEVIEVAEDGSTNFDLGFLRNPPKEPDNSNLGSRKSALLHSERLKCPAIHVRGLIPMMMEIVPEIIVRAQEEIVAKAKRDAAAREARNKMHEGGRSIGRPGMSLINGEIILEEFNF